MKVLGDLNNISKEIKPRTLKPGEVVTYQFLGGYPNTDPDIEARKERPYFWPEAVTLRLSDRIYDKGKGEYVEIGIPETIEKGEVKRFKKLELKAQANQGIFFVTGGRAADQELFEFLEICNSNESNPDRDESVNPWFKRIDLIVEAKEKNKQRTTLEKAIMYKGNMGEAKMREFAAAMGWNELADIEILEDQIGEMVMENPKGFLDFAIDEKGLKEKGLIKTALTYGIINYDVATHKILWASSNTPIAALERVEGKDKVELFYNWIVENKNGQNIYKSLQTKVNAAIREKQDKEAEV
jgi:hypothetical protein